MKICFVCGEYPPGAHGGIGTMTQVLGRALLQQGHEVRVVGACPESYDAPDTENDHGVQVLRLREKRYPLSWVNSRYRVYKRVAQWVRAGEVDIVEVPDYQGWAAGWRPLAKPVVTRLHGSLAYFARELHKPVDKTSYWLERASLRRADYACSVCRYTADMTEQVFKIPMHATKILYNPVEIPATAPNVARTRNRVVFSGTLTPKKGIVSLVKAWPRVILSSPGAELHVYGKDGRAEDGSSMRELLLASLPEAARASVRFHGHVSRNELFDIYRTAAVAVFPSYAEAFAIAPLEAMACGCPTIFTTRGSGPELLTHQREGLLVDPDKQDEIAGAILRVLEDACFAMKIGEAGRTRVQDVFSIENLVMQNVNFYERCLEDFRAKSARN